MSSLSDLPHRRSTSTQNSFITQAPIPKLSSTLSPGRLLLRGNQRESEGKAIRVPVLLPAAAQLTKQRTPRALGKRTVLSPPPLHQFLTTEDGQAQSTSDSSRRSSCTERSGTRFSLVSPPELLLRRDRTLRSSS